MYDKYDQIFNALMNEGVALTLEVFECFFKVAGIFLPLLLLPLTFVWFSWIIIDFFGWCALYWNLTLFKKKILFLETRLAYVRTKLRLVHCVSYYNIMKTLYRVMVMSGVEPNLFIYQTLFSNAHSLYDSYMHSKTKVCHNM